MYAQTLDYCAEQLHRYDRERFIASLLMRPAMRLGLWALGAFNLEIARTREVVSDTTLGLIRLQWWRDALGAFYERGEVAAQPVMRDLAATIRDYDLPRADFESLLYAREFDLEDRPPGTMEGLGHYADFTHTPLLRLMLRVVGEDFSAPAVENIAKAYALAGLLRAVPFHAGQGRCYLPEDRMHLYGIDVETLYNGGYAHENGDNIGKLTNFHALIEEITNYAAQNLDEAHYNGRFVTIMARQARFSLGQMRKSDFNPYDERCRLAPLFYPLRLGFGA